MLRRERRGPYKKYLSPGNDVTVPKKTIQYHNREESRTLGLTESSPEPMLTPSFPVDIELVLPSTSRLSTYGDSHFMLDDRSEGLEDNELLSINDRTDVESKDSQSDGSSNYDCNSDNDSFDDESESDENIPVSPELNEIVAGQCNKSRFEILLLILTYSIRHSLTTVAIVDLMKLINSVIGRNVLPQTKYWFSKIFDGGVKFTYHLYCPTCMTYIGPVPHGDREYSVQCPSCPDSIVTYSVNNDNPSVFVTISMSDQLKTLLETRKDIQMNLNYRNERISENGTIKDIFDGLAYKRLTKKNSILSNENNYSITFNTDGAPVYKSSKCSIWPLQFFMNELPPNVRFDADNVLLCGLWFGSKEPRMDVFMIPFVEEALQLENNGIIWKNNDGEKIHSKFVFLCCCLDSVARPMVQGIKQFNGYFGCAYCLHPGENVEGNQVRFTSLHPSPEERNNEVLRQNMEHFAKTNLSVNGVKGVSPLIVLPNFDLVFGFVLDYMHCILLGVTKFMTNMWLDSSNHNQPFYIGLSVDVIDKRLEKIAPPSSVSRNPRSINLRCHWKANEWRNWLLFYSLPCLKGVLPKPFFNHFAVLVGAIFVLLKDSISYEEIDMVHLLLNDFVLEFEQCYGKCNMTYNVHLLKHIGKHVSLWGPLWAYSAFVFESGNNTLLKLIKGTTEVASQIVIKYLRYSSVPRLLEKYDVQDSTLQCCSDVMSLPLTRKISKIDNICLLGLPCDDVLTEEDISAFQDGNYSPTTIYYKRILFKGVKYSCELYDRQKRNCDFVAYLSCRPYVFVIIKRFVILNNEIYMLCRKVRTTNNICNVGICHIKCCQTDVSRTVCLKPVYELCGQALLINFGQFSYVSIFPKKYDKD